MARPLRFEYAGATYHVMARGDGGKRIFLDEEDAKGFFFRLAEVCERCGWKVHAYVLMSNHFHLLLETPEPNLVDGMRYLMGTFSQGWNARHQRRGHVFQGRYKSIPVSGERAADGSYFRVTADYIHLNPARARLLTGEPLTSYAWSSLPAYESGKGPKWLHPDRVLDAFHLDLRHRGRKAYVAYLQRRAEENGGDLSDEAMRELRKGWYLGSDGFRDQLVNQINDVSGKLIKKGSVSGPVAKAHKEADAEHVIQLLGVEMEYNADREFLAQQRKGVWQKALMAAMVKKHCAVSNEWIAKRLAMGHPAGMSKVVKLYQENKEGSKLMKYYEKILKSKD
jgi:REP element-mobilizing transposase RayT